MSELNTEQPHITAIVRQRAESVNGAADAAVAAPLMEREEKAGNRLSEKCK